MPESKPLQYSRCDETSAAVACAAAASAATAATAAARGRSCINHRTEAVWSPAAAVLIIALKLQQSPTAAAAEEKLVLVWKCNCASRHNFVDVANY